jgi:hypothetical protein
MSHSEKARGKSFFKGRKRKKILLSGLSGTGRTY